MSGREPRPEQENRLPGLTDFEAALAQLAPRIEGFDRERLMFLAGQAAVLRDRAAGRSWKTRWAWPAAFSAMTAVAASLLLLLCLRSESTVATRDSEPNDVGQNSAGNGATGGTPAAAREVIEHSPACGDPASADSYAELRERILRQGDEAFRPRPPAFVAATTVAEGPLPYHVLLDRLLKPRSGGRQ
jgi:hypothetical protein